MLAHQILDLRPGGIIQGVVGGAHVGELGVPALAGNGPRGEQGVLGRRGAKRAVGMPQAIAQIEQPLPVVTGEDLMVPVQVRHISERGAQAALTGFGDIAADGVLDVSEVLAEGHLLIVAQGLVTKQQHGVAVQARLDGGHLLRCDGLRDIHAAHLGKEIRRCAGDGDAHGRLLW